MASDINYTEVHANLRDFVYREIVLMYRNVETFEQ
jgi:hypothetical protein